MCSRSNAATSRLTLISCVEENHTSARSGEGLEQLSITVSAIHSFDQLILKSRVCFFAGENGTGKSTLLEAIAMHYGFGPEGGTRSFSNDSTESNRSTAPLVQALRLSFDKRTGAYGGRSLHTRSHGETFFTLLELKFQRKGLFLLDEPEAALSPQRQLAFLVLLRDVLRKHKDAQFIISTHSPVLLGFPDAQIVSFDDGTLHEISYEETLPMQIVRRFVNDRGCFLEELFRDTPSLLRTRPSNAELRDAFAIDNRQSTIGNAFVVMPPP